MTPANDGFSRFPDHKYGRGDRVIVTRCKRHLGDATGEGTVYEVDMPAWNAIAWVKLDARGLICSPSIDAHEFMDDDGKLVVQCVASWHLEPLTLARKLDATEGGRLQVEAAL